MLLHSNLQPNEPPKPQGEAVARTVNFKPRARYHPVDRLRIPPHSGRGEWPVVPSEVMLCTSQRPAQGPTAGAYLRPPRRPMTKSTDSPDWSDDLVLVRCNSCFQNDIVPLASLHSDLSLCRECLSPLRPTVATRRTTPTTTLGLKQLGSYRRLFSSSGWKCTHGHRQFLAYLAKERDAARVAANPVRRRADHDGLRQLLDVVSSSEVHECQLPTVSGSAACENRGRAEATPLTRGVDPTRRAGPWPSTGTGRPAVLGCAGRRPAGRDVVGAHRSHSARQRVHGRLAGLRDPCPVQAPLAALAALCGRPRVPRRARPSAPVSCTTREVYLTRTGAASRDDEPPLLEVARVC